MRLFLAEKPSQARDIARVLGVSRKENACIRGDGVTVTWCFGHLLEMAPPQDYDPALKQWRVETLPILPDQWRMNVRPKVKGHFSSIRSLLKQASEVVVATDADREGETIAREVLELCGYRGPVQRLWLAALDETSVRKALANLLPGDQTYPLYRAGVARARADWLVGMNLTRAYTLAARARGYDGVLSVGRVQTPTLKLVVDRDRAIEQFKPVPYYEVSVRCGHTNGSWEARWVPPEGVSDAEGRCTSQQAAASVAQRVQGVQGTVTLAQTERKRENAPLPYDLSTLQQEASKRLGMGAQEVLDTAQSLYEKHKATSYPRTDCRYLPVSQHGEARDVLQGLMQSDSTIEHLVEGADASVQGRCWNDAKITAHHAIIPTTAAADVHAMSSREQAVYDLIRRRFIAQFYPAYEYDQTRLEVAAEGETFRAQGRVNRRSGWRVLIQTDASAEERNESAQALPSVQKGDPVSLAGAQIRDKETTPPERFTQGTLLAAMKNIARTIADERLRRVLKENTGIGTEATRAGIIQTLMDRGYLEEQKKKLTSTAAARSLIDALPDPVKDPSTTALWEQALDQIANGEGEIDGFLQRQAEWVKRLVQHVQQQGADAVQVEAQAQNACPTCSAPMRRRKGGSGAFWGCTRYPDCTTTLPDQGGKPGKAPKQGPVGQCGCAQQGNIKESPKAWQCEACNAIVWKQVSGKKLTEAQALTLFAGDRVQLKGLKSKRTGKTFDAGAKLSEGKVQLQFD
ncbi:DNA topoisomerase III [Thioalkalivibrio sp. ALE9]|uniref:DNA topoisomerase III n=1 Tax=Thioalkalivibrio sp. ALE9 TaxID=1158169 RepID=UPI0003AA4442|nr:DNA topoisomerase III [Thioalkalivibrio sp. ALE9]